MKTKIEKVISALTTSCAPLVFKGELKGVRWVKFFASFFISHLFPLIFVSTLIFHLSSFSFAASPGTDGAQFLKLGTGARPIGMGEAFAAVADDANAVLWNPGGLGFLKQKEFTAMHLEYLENIRFSGISYVHPTDDWGNFAANVSYLYTNDIQRTVLSDTRPEGFESRGNFGVSDRSFMFAYGKIVATNHRGKEYRTLGIGMGLRYIEESLDSFSASAFAVDFGALYRINPRVRFGFALQNLGSKLKFVRESESLPLVVRAGIGGTELDNRLNYSFEFFYPRDTGLELHTGAEFWVMRLFAPRLGWRFRQLQRDSGLSVISGITGGFGIRLFNYQLDYAIVPFSDFGNTHRISLTGRF